MNNQFYNIPIFKNMTDEEIINCISSLNSKSRSYQKGETIYHAGSKASHIGIVLKGSCNIEYIDFLGNRSIINKIEKNKLIAEAYSFLDINLLVDIIASEETKILFLDTKYINSKDNLGKSWHHKFLSTLLYICLKRNIMLSEKIFSISNKTLRLKITSYLDMVSKENNKKEFDIPFNREELADYLNADRSALSKELSKMKKEKIIDYHKNHFVLLQ